MPRRRSPINRVICHRDRHGCAIVRIDRSHCDSCRPHRCFDCVPHGSRHLLRQDKRLHPHLEFLAGDFEQLDDDAVARPGLAAVVLLTALLVCAPAFRASGDPATRRLIIPAAVLLAVGLVADLARACGHLAHPLGATLLFGAGMLATRTLLPWRSDATGEPERFARAARTVSERATDTLAPFTLRPDKQFFFGADGSSFTTSSAPMARTGMSSAWYADIS